MFFDPDIFLLPIIALALALIVFGVPYCFISNIKDLRVRWAIAGAYAGFLLALTLVVDLHHFYELFAVFSISKTLLMIWFIVVGGVAGWTGGGVGNRRKNRR